MTWVEEYRRGLGLSRAQFAAAITRKLGGRGEGRAVIPAALITILEEQNGARTHPRLMTIIARACGATKEQRDQFLHPSRRDWPYLHQAAQVTEKEAHPWRAKPGATTKAARQSAKACANNMRAVVIVDADGVEVARTDSVKAAAARAGMDETTISAHLRRKVSLLGSRCRITYRYADEWDAMTREQRIADILDVSQVGRIQPRHFHPEAVVAVEKDGREAARYTSCYEAAKGEGISQTPIYKRCRRKVKREFSGECVRTYRFAREWDAMSEAARKQDVGAV